MPRYEYPGYKPAGEGWLGARPGTVGGYHGGTDNPAAAGTPVYAEHGGQVFRSGPINGYGMSVIVESTAPDGTRFYELYGHLGPGPLPDPGTEITAGQPIPGAVIGTKNYVQSQGGLSTGPHLHREIISGKVRLNTDGGLGLYSSEIRHKADPETFDINHPTFPYENKEPLPPPISPARPNNLVTPQRPGSSTGAADRPDASSRPATNGLSRSQLLPGMPIPGAAGPTSIGGPAGPTPMVPPAQPRSQPPAAGLSETRPILPELNFAPDPRPNVGPFMLPGPFHADASPTIRGLQDQPRRGPVTAAPAMPPRQMSRQVPSPIDAARRPAVQIGDGGEIANLWDGSPVGHSSPDWDLFPPNLSLPTSPGSFAVGRDGQSSPLPPLLPFPLQSLLADDPGRSRQDGVTFPSSVQTVPPVQDAPGGLLGLLASVAGNDPANPFVPTLPEDEVPVRRLVSRLAQF